MRIARNILSLILLLSIFFIFFVPISLSTKMAALACLGIAAFLLSNHNSVSRQKKQNDTVFAITFCFITLFVWILCAFSGTITDRTSYIIGHGGMEPTLSSGDLVTKKQHTDFKRGDIVFYYLDDNKILLQRKIEESRKLSYKKNTYLMIGRIIGIPLDSVLIRNGNIYINQKKIIENYVEYNETTTNGSFEIPLNNFFILKDNRKVGIDSRHFGPINSDFVLPQKIDKIYKYNQLNIRDYYWVILGVLFFIACVALPYIFYKKTYPTKILHFILLIHITFVVSLIVVVIVKHYASIDPLYPYKPHTMLIDLSHRISSFFDFIFLQSKFATVASMLFGWIGGMISTFEIVKVIKTRKNIG